MSIIIGRQVHRKALAPLSHFLSGDRNEAVKCGTFIIGFENKFARIKNSTFHSRKCCKPLTHIKVKELLMKIKLIEHLTTDVEIQKTEFVSKFRDSVDEGSTGVFLDAFDIFSSSKNEYKGYVGNENFKIKRKRKLFDMNMSTAVASGIYHQNNEKLIIETEINGFNEMMILFYLLAIVFYSIFIITFLTVDNIQGNVPGLTFILIHGAFLFGISYFIMRRSVNRMKHELEREFFYLTKK